MWLGDHVLHFIAFQLNFHSSITKAQKVENCHYIHEKTMKKSQGDDQSKMTSGLIITLSQLQTNTVPVQEL